MERPQPVDVVVEIPRGSRNKYELDEERGVIRFDRRLTGAVSFPADYGFVPDTEGADGEPLDALVLMDEPVYPGVWVACHPVGVFWIETSEGREAKLICVPAGDPAYDDVGDVRELPRHVLDTIEQFFEVYKLLEPGHSPSSAGFEGAERARAVLDEARRS